MLHHSNLPLSYWSYAFSTTVYLINRIPSSILNFISSWEKLYDHKPSFTALKTFVCACYPLLKPYNSHKFDSKSRQCIFLGYPPQSKVYICLDVLSGKIYISCHCVFDESIYPHYLVPSFVRPASTFSYASPPSFNVWLSTLLPCSFLPVSSPTVPIDTQIVSSTFVPPNPIDLLPIQSVSTPNTTVSPTAPVTDSISTSTAHTQEIVSYSTITPSPSTNTHPMRTRSKNDIFKPKAYVVQTDYSCIEPPSYYVASKFPNLLEAMDFEFKSLQQHQTWSLVPLPPNKNVVGCKWVYKVKRNNDGSIARLKLGLLSKGICSNMVWTMLKLLVLWSSLLL